MSFTVYMHENRIDGKKYIGITSQKPTRRWANGNGYKNNGHFYAAIEKYGWDAFDHRILFTDLAQDEAERKEIELIAKYNTCDRHHGYNIDSGGVVHHPTAETRHKMSVSRMGERNGFYGRQHTDEVKARLREYNKGKTRTESARLAQSLHSSKNKTVYQYDVEGNVVSFYRSKREAMRQTGIDMGKALIGQQKTAGGYVWRYDDHEPVGVP